MLCISIIIKDQIILFCFPNITGTLQIERSQESDAGKYECVAENSVGVAYSFAANLYVRGKLSVHNCAKYPTTIYH